MFPLLGRSGLLSGAWLRSPPPGHRDKVAGNGFCLVISL